MNWEETGNAVRYYSAYVDRKRTEHSPLMGFMLFIAVILLAVKIYQIAEGIQ